MRDIPEDLAARIESGAVGLCHVWLMQRRDGKRLGFTDHDANLVIDGVLCRASGGWTAGATEMAVGLAAGSATALGGLELGGLDEAAISDGAFDGAEVALWRVDWGRPDLRVRLWVKTLGRLRREGETYLAELEGPLARLERVVGRTYGRECDALFGDARCGVEAAPGASCDKRWATCTTVHGNGANFQGFPHVPGDDFLTAYPKAGGRHDGGRR